MKLWMAVLPDAFELPIAVEYSAQMLAEKMGTTNTNIKSKATRGNSGKSCGYKVVTVDGDKIEESGSRQ